MLEDIFGSVVNEKAAEAAIEEAEALFMQCRIKEADAVLTRQLRDTPDHPEILDEAIKIKCIRYCYSEVARLVEAWQTVTGKDYPLVEVMRTAAEFQAGDAPEMADETYACLAEQAPGLRIMGASNGLYHGRFVNYLTVDASDEQVAELNAAIADRLRERLGIEQPGIVVVSNRETKSLDVNGKLRQLDEKGFDVETFIDSYRETLMEHGVDPEDPQVVAILARFLDIMVERIDMGHGPEKGVDLGDLF